MIMDFEKEGVSHGTERDLDLCVGDVSGRLCLRLPERMWVVNESLARFS